MTDTFPLQLEGETCPLSSGPGGDKCEEKEP